MRIVRAGFLYLAALGACGFAVRPVTAAEGNLVRGPVDAQVERVIDGDTFFAVAYIWPGHSVRVSVRIRGIDAPERKSRCAAEREAAEAARQVLEKLLGGASVRISNIGGGKYYGRVLADVTANDGRPVAEALLASGLARRYSGKGRTAWCG